MTTDYTVCLVTVEDKKSAAKITDCLLKLKLAACVSAVSGLSSVYRWQGKIERASETLLIIKTRAALRSAVTAAVRLHHPASVPEILFFNIAGGSRAYLDWLRDNAPSASGILKGKVRNKGL